MNRVLLTGAAGFTGRYLAPQLQQAGYEVHGCDHHHNAVSLPALHQYHHMDLRDRQSIDAIVALSNPHKVIHLAGISFVAHSNLHEMYETNIQGTRNLLESLAERRDFPSAVLLASSANIYGNSPRSVLDETVPPCPANDYGVTKAAMELVANLFADQLPTIVLRPFNYTGRGQSAEFLIPKIVGHFAARMEAIELGNMSVARDFSDVRNVAEIYLRLLSEPRAIGQTFNVCSGRAVTTREIIKLLQDMTGHAIEVRVNPDFVRANEVASLIGSAEKLESVIGPVSSIPLEETLRWMLEG